MKEYLARAEAYAYAHGDLREFKHIYISFRAKYNIAESVWRTLSHMYGNGCADTLQRQ